MGLWGGGNLTSGAEATSRNRNETNQSFPLSFMVLLTAQPSSFCTLFSVFVKVTIALCVYIAPFVQKLSNIMNRNSLVYLCSASLVGERVFFLRKGFFLVFIFLFILRLE